MICVTTYWSFDHFDPKHHRAILSSSTNLLYSSIYMYIYMIYLFKKTQNHQVIMGLPAPLWSLHSKKTKILGWTGDAPWAWGSRPGDPAWNKKRCINVKRRKDRKIKHMLPWCFCWVDFDAILWMFVGRKGFGICFWLVSWKKRFSCGWYRVVDVFLPFQDVFFPKIDQPMVD